ncbi:hypothetical protein NQ317_005920 [Molorchus minor]|uniref:Uncharacterized protein n=1 Tax=Molorchus minor TaxID=1323400 RepID=A0ABQ9JH20_9CUCU|nr:hypothetical protein NQ317_005920 [Molorchus minor]
MPDIKNTVSSLDDLSHELQRFGHDYTIERFQRKPFIMMLKINGTSATLMGMGESEKDALVDLYQMAVYMFSKGFSLKF